VKSEHLSDNQRKKKKKEEKNEDGRRLGAGGEKRTARSFHRTNMGSRPKKLSKIQNPELSNWKVQLPVRKGARKREKRELEKSTTTTYYY